jgi:hypothetical protein
MEEIQTLLNNAKQLTEDGNIKVLITSCYLPCSADAPRFSVVLGLPSYCRFVNYVLIVAGGLFCACGIDGDATEADARCQIRSSL